MQDYTINVGAGRVAVFSRPRGGDWLGDEAAEWRRFGADTVVSLLTTQEEKTLGLENEADAVGKQGIAYKSFPIPDREIPPSRAGFLELIRSLAAQIESGRTVAIHCRQGVGRSGLVAAGILIAAGMAPAAAIERVGQARGVVVPETREQRDWLLATAPAIQKQAA